MVPKILFPLGNPIAYHILRVYFGHHGKSEVDYVTCEVTLQYLDIKIYLW